MIDTAFNGGLELPLELKGQFNDVPIGQIKCVLGGGREIEEDAYEIDFPFDDSTMPAFATYAECEVILIGTQILKDYILTIDFPRHELYLEHDA